MKFEKEQIRQGKSRRTGATCGTAPAAVVQPTKMLNALDAWLQKRGLGNVPCEECGYRGRHKAGCTQKPLRITGRQCG